MQQLTSTTIRPVDADTSARATGTPVPAALIGVVVIGRNEGERLTRCLASLRNTAAAIVYVDSNSTDNSLENARAVGCEVVSLDMSRRFTAARARNAGLAQLIKLAPHLAYVQFLDGDCEMASGWIDVAARTLHNRIDVAAVCGRRRERYLNATIYNRLCDMEWDTPIGNVRACGGDVLMRLSALRQVGGYREDMIAGEEPELCVRLRSQGWTIVRLAQDMSFHDAAITRFTQWWKRSVRAGHAYAEGAWLHGRSPLRHNVKQVISVVFWALALPLLLVATAWPTRGCTLLLLPACYAVLVSRITLYRRQRGDTWSTSLLYASFCVLAKFVHLQGILSFVWNTLIRRRSRELIEYK